MARSWLEIRVELVEGLGETYWPRPGRIIVAPRRTTFAELAETIDVAFGRWDLAHLHAFTLADGRRLTLHGPWTEGLDHEGDDTATASLAGLANGESFAYEFDFGDSWLHLCTVADQRVDPVEVLGTSAGGPQVVFGWGTLPDQYGRLTDGSDDDEEELRPDPDRSDLPPLVPGWGDDPEAGHGSAFRALLMERLREPTRADAAALRAAGRTGDGQVALDVLEHVRTESVLHIAGPALMAALRAGLPGAFGQYIHARHVLTGRGLGGDLDLEDELIRAVRGDADAPELREVPVDLDELVTHLEGSGFGPEGARLDLRTGQVWLDDSEAMTGVAPPDDWGDGRSWLRLDSLGSHDAWEDMADFAGELEDGELGERLLDAIEGRGAFARFRRLIEDRDDVIERWLIFREDRQLSRARAFLAANGCRPAVPSADG